MFYDVAAVVSSAPTRGSIMIGYASTRAAAIYQYAAEQWDPQIAAGRQAGKFTAASLSGISRGGGVAMAGRIQRVSVLMLGALILGTGGATVGSWYGARSLTPLPSDAQAVVLASELLPGIAPAGGTDRRDYQYGYALGDDDFGPGYVEVRYAPFRENLDGVSVNCGLSRPARANATRHGWRHIRSLPGYPCDSWLAERGDLAATFTQDLDGPVLTFYRATPAGLGSATLIGALLGAMAGAVAFWLMNRRHRPVLLLIATPPTDLGHPRAGAPPSEVQ